MAEAIHRIGKLDLASIAGDSLAVCLNETGVFSHKHHNTLHIRPSEGKNSYAMKRLRDCIMDALGMDHEEPYHPHMTIGQSDDTLSSSHLFLADKIRLLTPYEWDADNLAVLVRDPERAGTSTGPRSMSLWGSVNLGRSLPVQLPAAGKFYGTDDGDDGITAKAKPQTTYNCVSPTDAWKPYLPSGLTDLPDDKPDRLIVASYNVLAEFEWPPSLERHADTIANILSNRAAADILVLEEVTDQFLSFLLADPEVRRRYPYSTHGPSDSPGVGPLPSLLNVIVLSRFALQWSYLPFHRKHKGAVIATFPSLRNCGSPETGSSRLVVAACHLSQGLVDAAVVAKKTEIQRLLAHLSDDFNGHPWIIAGDFNLATSSYSLDAARQRQDLSPESYRYLRGFDSMLTDMGLQDSWVASRVLSGESSDQISGQRLVCELHEGEQGATFDPLTNELAAKMVGSGLKKRPQRYDRIFVNSHLRLRPCRFNMFGFSLTNHNHGQARGVASDHWGIRCLLERPDSRMLDTSRAVQGNAPQLVRAAPTLGGLEEIKRCLGSRGSLASELDAQRRTQAIKLLERALQCRDYGDLDGNLRKGPRLVLLPVGSFALGVWDPASDIDCLCIGEMSQRTFFSLAKSRLRKLSSAGITLLRKVRANSGTMLELDVTGIKFDLQYCSAASILRQ
jgi:endonuclease/exonuclease/phosphatase family metal-dependent hydrolase